MHQERRHWNDKCVHDATKATAMHGGSNNNKRIAPNKLLCTKSIFVCIIIIQFDHKFMNINSIRKQQAHCGNNTHKHTHTRRVRERARTPNDNLLIEKMATQGDRTIYLFFSFLSVIGRYSAIRLCCDMRRLSSINRFDILCCDLFRGDGGGGTLTHTAAPHTL